MFFSLMGGLPMVVSVFSWLWLFVRYFLMIMGSVWCFLQVSASMYSSACSPSYQGKIHDCRQLNAEAVMAAYGLMKDGYCEPNIAVYQYAEEDVTIISFATDSATLHCLFKGIPVKIITVPGKAPSASPSTMRLAVQ